MTRSKHKVIAIKQIWKM